MNFQLLTARHLGWAIGSFVRERAKVVDWTHISEGWWGTAGEPMDYTTREHIDVTISVLWPEIIKPEQLADHAYINIHPAPLPEYRGCNSYAHAIINGEEEYGVTMHYMNAGVDTGPIIASPRFPIPPYASGRDLYDLAQDKAFRMFLALWPMLKGGLPPATVQPQEGRYYRRDSLERYFGSPDPVVRRALTFPPFTNGYDDEEGLSAGQS